MASFSKIAGVERRIIKSVRTIASLQYNGYCEVLVQAWLLDELGVDYTQLSGGSRHLPRVSIYAPVWVYATQFYTETKTKWDILRPLLIAMRDDVKEQEMWCAELSLDGRVARSVREAAQHWIDILLGRRKVKSLDESPATNQRVRL